MATCLQRPAGLTGDDEERLREIELAVNRQDLLRIGRIENQEFEHAWCNPERRAQHFGREAAAAHAEQHCVRVSFGRHVLRPARQLIRGRRQCLVHG